MPRPERGRSDSGHIGARQFVFQSVAIGIRIDAEAFGLDGDTITRFALALGEPEQREILAGIEAHRDDEHWAEKLQSPYSSWFQLRHALAKRWEPHLFEEISRRHVARNWTLAPPLVSSLLRRHRYEEALAIVQTASHRACIGITPSK